MASNKKGSSISSKSSLKDKAFTGLGSLIKLLPTGTMFLFQFLSPVLSNNGHCHPLNKYLMGALLVVCGLNCTVATFTDSYIDDDGDTHYGIATKNGLWPEPTPSSKYRIRAGDFVHAVMSLVVFGVVAVLDNNTVGCFAPGWDATRRTLLVVLPPIVGVICSGVLAVFPSTRHGIGYPADPDHPDTA